MGRLARLPRGSRGRWALTAVLGAGALLGAFILGAYAHKEFFFRDFVKPLLAENLRVPVNFLAGRFTPAEHLVIDVKHVDFQKIAYVRQQALAAGVLLPTLNEFVPARVRYGGRTTRARIRLKGYLPDHWEDDYQWSFRIQLRGDETIRGMREFSVSHPKTRNYLNEWFFQKLLAHNDLISLRFDYLTVTLNGKDLGVYSIEEAVDKRLVERNRRRDGPVIRFTDDLHWYDLKSTHLYQTYVTSDIDSFQSGRLAKDPEHLTQFEKAKNLLESYRKGALPASKVFDTGKLARFFALLDLIANPHPSEFHNMGFYYNPVTSLLEPLGRDGEVYNRGMPNVTYLIGAKKPFGMTWEDRLAQDPEFFGKYVAALKDVSRPEYLDEFFAATRTEYRKALRILHKRNPLYSFESSRAVLYANQAHIRSAIDPVKAVSPHFRRFDAATGILEFDVGNIQTLHVRVLKASVAESEFLPALETVLSGKLNNSLVENARISFRAPKGFIWRDDFKGRLTLTYEILGAGNPRVEKVLPWPRLGGPEAVRDAMRLEPNAARFPFLRVEKHRVLVPPGRWRLAEPLVIGPGSDFVMGAGSELILERGAMIVSRSPVHILGTEARPAILRGEGGQGLIVLGAGSSALKHAVFEGLSPPSAPGWNIVGAVTFYESPVDIADCVFRRNRGGDDILNIIRSSFTIDSTHFEGTFADAVDLDFVTGAITRSTFKDCGTKDNNGDCLDASGSSVRIEDVAMEGAGDKGMSVGEMSAVTAKRVRVSRANIGVASKDLSTLHISGLAVSASRYGIVAYRKKPEFGPSSIYAEDVSAEGVGTPRAAELGSTIVVDGVAEPQGRADLLAEIYPAGQ